MVSLQICHFEMTQLHYYDMYNFHSVFQASCNLKGYICAVLCSVHKLTQ